MSEPEFSFADFEQYDDEISQRHSESGGEAGSTAKSSFTDFRVRRCPDCGGDAADITKWCRLCNNLGSVRMTPVDKRWL